MPNGNGNNGGTWGGPRPGAGAKKKFVRVPVADAKKRDPYAKPAAAPRSFLPSPDQVAAILEASKAHARNHVRTDENNPFRIYAHPPYAMPRDTTKQMAFDTALIEQVNWAGQAWMAGEMFSGIAGEGLLFLGYPFLSELAQRPEYRTIAETIADDATRKWVDFEVVGGKKAKKARDAGEEPDPDDKEADLKENGKLEKVKAIKDELVRLEARDRFYCACRDDGFFGRTHMFMNFGEDITTGDDKELTMPIGNGRSDLSRGKVAKGTKFQRLQIIEPVWTYPQAYNAINPLLDTWYNPQQWYVMGKEIHCSRLLTMIGHPVPDMLKPAYSFGGLSLSQIAKPYVDNWLRTRTSVGELIHAFSVMILMTDLQTTLQPGNANALLLRIAMFNALRDNQGAFVINKTTEDVKNVSAPLSGLDQLQAQSQEHVCSVVRIPLVKYTGISPHGLNASSEGEIMVYDDTISSYQNRFIRPPLTTVVNFVQLAIWGEVDPEITMEFETLRVMTEEQKAELQKKNAERDQVYVDMGAFDAGEIRKVAIDDPELPYSGFDPDDVPEPPQPEGGEGGFGGEEGGGPDPMFGKEPGGANDAVIPFAGDAAPWSESDHPRGQPGNAGQFGSGSGGGGGGKQKIKAPQFGMSPTPRSSHQMKAETGGEFFEQNWHKAASVGGHSQPTPKQIEAYLDAYEHQGAAPPPTPQGPAPLQPKALKRVGKQMGTNPGGVFENAQGERFYVKQGQTKEHVDNELAAADLYRLAGARTLEYQAVEGGEHVATRMAKLDKNRATQFSPAEVKAARRDFVTHAWLANWDAVGTGSDNLGTIEGEPTALDLGGALSFRAQGAPKGAAFGDKVNELEVMRDPGMSPDAAKVFGGMSPDELKESAQRVTSIPDEEVRRVIAGRSLPLKVAETLIKRKHDIASRFGMATDEWKESDHPRSPDGKFGSGGGGGGGGGKGEMIDLGGGMKVSPEEATPEELEKAGLDPATMGELSAANEGDPEKDWSAGIDLIDSGEGSDLDKAQAKLELAKSIGLPVDDGIVVGSMSDEELAALEEKYGSLTNVFGSEPEKDLGGLKLSPEEAKSMGVGQPDKDGKAKKTKFGGLWKESGGGPVEDYNKNAAIVLGKPANAGQSYRQMLAFLINENQKHGIGGSDLVGLKAKLLEAWHKAHAKLIDEYSKAPPDKAPKLLAELHKIEAKLKEVGSPAELKVPEEKPAPKTETKTTPKEQVKQFNPKFYEAAQKVDQAKTTDLSKAKMKIIAAKNPANAGTVEALQEMLTPSQTSALQKVYGSITSAWQKIIGAQSEPAASPSAFPQAPAAIAASFPKPTEAELNKAKKSVALQMQYVLPGGGAPETPVTKGLLKLFNDKYEGKTLTPSELVQKVNDYKVLQAAVGKVKEKADAEANAKQSTAAAEQQKKNKSAAEALKATQAAAKAKNQEYVKALGISETEATGFDALVQMMGKDAGADVVAQFQHWEKEAKSKGLKNVTGFQYALIRNYIDGGYKSINNALRAGSWSAAQHVYARLVNKALDAFPKYSGTVVRGATLSPSQIAKYQAGHVVSEASFTSTGKGYQFGGNVHYTIKATGKRGADFAETEVNEGEAEVLFKANTFFIVHKVENKNGVTHIEMEEVDDHG